MTGLSLAEFAAALARLGEDARRVATEHPDWSVTRNRIGNAAILDGAGDYVGFVDSLAGDLQLLEDVDP